MRKTVVLTWVQAEGYEPQFVSQVDAVVHPDGSVHVVLTPSHLIDYNTILAEAIDTYCQLDENEGEDE